MRDSPLEPNDRIRDSLIAGMLSLSVYGAEDCEQLLPDWSVGLELEVQKFPGEEIHLAVGRDVEEVCFDAGVGLGVELHSYVPFRVALPDQRIGPELAVLPTPLSVADRVAFESNGDVSHVTDSVAVFMPKPLCLAFRGEHDEPIIET
jgi:hypothetical protein